jgi:hypothetical protein
MVGFELQAVLLAVTFRLRRRMGEHASPASL